MKLEARQRYSPPSRSDTLARRRRASASALSLIHDCGDKRPGSGAGAPPDTRARLPRSWPSPGPRNSQEGCLEEAWRRLAAGAVLTLDTAARHAPPLPTDPQRGPPPGARAARPWGPSCVAARPESSGHRPTPSLHSRPASQPHRVSLTAVSLWAADVAITPTGVAPTPGPWEPNRHSPALRAQGGACRRRRAPLWVCRPLWTDPAPRAHPAASPQAQRLCSHPGRTGFPPGTPSPPGQPAAVPTLSTVT